MTPHLTKSQLDWLRRLVDYKWWKIPEQPLAALVRQGLAEQRADGRIRLTAFGLNVIKNKSAQIIKTDASATVTRVINRVKPRIVAQRIETPTPSGWRYYWAYGSNLSIDAMRRRCPGAKKVQALSLPDGALVFRGVADAVWAEGETIHGGLWLITREHERELDRYEGVAAKLYDKCYLRLKVNGEEVRALYYQMRVDGIFPPTENYIEIIAQGYRDFGLPIEALDRALSETWGNKNPTPYLRERQARRGGRLARRLQQQEVA